MNDKECTVGIKFQSIFESEYQSQSNGYMVNSQTKYMRYSILSLLNWIRIDSESSLLSQSSKLINIQNMILSLSKSTAQLRSIPLL